MLIYLAAPVTYIGIVQAALCDKLGASYAVASLPASLHLLGGLGPLICSWLIPYRLERATVVWSYGISTGVLAAVGTTLLLPLSNAVRIAALLAPGPDPGRFQFGGPRLRLPMPAPRNHHPPDEPESSASPSDSLPWPRWSVPWAPSSF